MKRSGFRFGKVQCLFNNSRTRSRCSIASATDSRHLSFFGLQSADSSVPRIEVTGLLRSCATAPVTVRSRFTEDWMRSNMWLKVSAKREISSESAGSGKRCCNSSVPIRDTVSVIRSTLTRVRRALQYEIKKPSRSIPLQTARKRSANRCNRSAAPRSDRPR